MKRLLVLVALLAGPAMAQDVLIKHATVHTAGARGTPRGGGACSHNARWVAIALALMSKRASSAGNARHNGRKPVTAAGALGAKVLGQRASALARARTAMIALAVSSAIS